MRRGGSSVFANSRNVVLHTILPTAATARRPGTYAVVAAAVNCRAESVVRRSCRRSYADGASRRSGRWEAEFASFCTHELEEAAAFACLLLLCKL